MGNVFDQVLEQYDTAPRTPSADAKKAGKGNVFEQALSKYDTVSTPASTPAPRSVNAPNPNYGINSNIVDSIPSSSQAPQQPVTGVTPPVAPAAGPMTKAGRGIAPQYVQQGKNVFQKALAELSKITRLEPPDLGTHAPREGVSDTGYPASFIKTRGTGEIALPMSGGSHPVGETLHRVVGAGKHQAHELIETNIMAAVAAGALTPLAVAGGLAAFMGIEEGVNAIASKVKGKEYKVGGELGVSDILGIKGISKDAVDAGQMLIEMGIIGGASKAGRSLLAKAVKLIKGKDGKADLINKVMVEAANKGVHPDEIVKNLPSDEKPVVTPKDVAVQPKEEVKTPVEDAPVEEVKKEPLDIRPVIETSESIIVGEPGQKHIDVLQEAGLEAGERKFSVNGEVKTREETRQILKEKEPEVYEKWAEINDEGEHGEPHMTDINEAREGVSQPEIKIEGKNAIKEGQVEEGNQREHSGVGEVREATEASSGDSIQESREGKGERGEGSIGRVTAEDRPIETSEAMQDDIPSKEITTGIKDAIVESEREAKGEEAIGGKLRANVEDLEGKVKERIKKGDIDPKKIAEDVTKELEGDKPVSARSTADSLALIYDRERMKIEYAKNEEMLETATGEEKVALEKRQAELDELFNKNDIAAEALGTAWSDIGRLRQEEIGEDFSLLGALQRLKKEGVKVTDAIKEKYKGMSKRIEEAKKDVDAVEEKKKVSDAKGVLKRLKKQTKKGETDGKPVTLEEGVFPDTRTLIKMAKEKIIQGITEADDIVKAIHKDITKAGIDATERQVSDGISEYGILKDMKKDEVSAALREARAQMKIMSAFEDVQEETAPLKSGLKREPVSEKVKEMRDKVVAMMKEAGVDIEKTSDNQWKTPLEAVNDRLNARMKDIAKKLGTGEGKEKGTGVSVDAETKALQDEVALLNRIMKDVVDPIRQQMHEPMKGGSAKEGKERVKKDKTLGDKIDAEIKTVERSIADHLRKINEGDFGPKKKGDVLHDPILDSLRETRDGLKGLVKDLRDGSLHKMTPEERAIHNFMKSTQKRIDEYERRIREKDFRGKKRVERALTQEESDLKFKLERAKYDFAKALIEDKIGSMGRLQKMGVMGLEAANLQRALMTSFDVSAVLRQGGFFSLGRPITSAKGLPAMFEALASEKGRFEAEQMILNDPMYQTTVKAKIQYTWRSTKLEQMEEVYMSRWAEDIPGIAGSERAFVTFLNLQRLNVFKLLANSWCDGKPTDRQAKDIARLVNDGTGRTNISDSSKMAKSFVAANEVFFAPRYLLSRFRLAIGAPIWQAQGIKMKARIAGEYARMLTGLGTIYALGSAAGAEIEHDVRSSDFGKMKFGNTRVDPLMGLSQVVVLMGRVVDGHTKKLTGDVIPIRGDDVPYGSPNTANVIFNFMRSKLSPIIGTAIDVAAGEDVTGQKVTLYDVPDKLLIPLPVVDVYEAMKEQGVPGGSALGILGIAGMGMQTFDPENKEVGQTKPIATLLRMITGEEEEDDAKPRHHPKRPPRVLRGDD